MKKKVAFVHGRPSGHPLHAAYAKSIDADFYHEDRLLRWHDRPDASKFKRYMSWVLNAIFFPNRRSYDVILTECIRIPQFFMKYFKLLRKEQKLIAIMGDESLYFLSINRYPKAASFIMKKFLNACDILVCTGDFQADLARKIVNKPEVQILNVFNGIELPTAQAKFPIRRTKKILILANLEAQWRAWYKGIDLMLGAFQSLADSDPVVELHFIGEISTVVQKTISDSLSNNAASRLSFHGRSNNLYNDIVQYDLLLHAARGEAWGITIHMAMAIGMPSIVSNITGAKQLVGQVDERLIAKPDKMSIIQTVEWFFSLSDDKKRVLSDKSISIASKYTLDKAVENFKKTVTNNI